MDYDIPTTRIVRVVGISIITPAKGAEKNSMVSIDYYWRYRRNRYAGFTS